MCTGEGTYTLVPYLESGKRFKETPRIFHPGDYYEIPTGAEVAREDRERKDLGLHQDSRPSTWPQHMYQKASN